MLNDSNGVRPGKTSAGSSMHSANSKGDYELTPLPEDVRQEPKIMPPADDDAYELADPPEHLRSHSQNDSSDDDAYELAEPRMSEPAVPMISIGSPVNVGQPRRTSGKSNRGLIIGIVGHIIAPLLGLALGYYVLCWLAPSANVLHLSLPGLAAPAAEK